MYSPKHYTENNLERIYGLIQKYSLATMISARPELTISHLPFLLEFDQAGKPKLLCHMARMNPHWKCFSPSSKEIVIFHGPNSYISPDWYTDAPDNVPTWNFAVVHVRGQPEIIRDPKQALDAMKTMIAAFEPQTNTNWRLPKPQGPEIDKLMEHIVVFEIHDLTFEAKFKLSQRETPENRATTIAALKKLDRDSQREIGVLMES